MKTSHCRIEFKDGRRWKFYEATNTATDAKRLVREMAKMSDLRFRIFEYTTKTIVTRKEVK